MEIEIKTEQLADNLENKITGNKESKIKQNQHRDKKDDKKLEQCKKPMKGKIKCMYTNIRSILNQNKREEIDYRLTSEKIDILGITESWANVNILDSELHFKDFTMFRKDRDVGDKLRGGGVLLYIRDWLNPQVDFENDEGEIVWASIKIENSRKVKIGVCYRSPDMDDKEVDKIFNSIKKGQLNRYLSWGTLITEI